MEIISLSLDQQTLDKIDYIEENAAFDGRSELIRKAVSDLYDDISDNNDISGEMNAVIVVRHTHESEHKISELSHHNDELISTQIHNKLDDDYCVELFLVEGEASNIVEFYRQLKGSKATEKVDMLPQE